MPFRILIFSLLSCITFVLSFTAYSSPRAEFRKLSMEQNSAEIKWFIPTAKQMNPQLDLTDSQTREPAEVIEVPIFPLDYGVAFPGSDFPLNIFVMSYRMMMNDIQKTGKRFGIAISNGEGQLGNIGTLLYNSQQILQEDGRQILLNKCLERFRILEIVRTTPYTVAKVELGIVDEDIQTIIQSLEGKEDFDLPGDLVTLENEVWGLVKELVAMTNKLSRGNNVVVVPEECFLLSPDGGLPDRLKICSTFSLSLCGMLGLDFEESQALLQTRSFRTRLQRLQEHLSEAMIFLKEAQSAMR
jgi:Lon protease-like protein